MDIFCLRVHIARRNRKLWIIYLNHESLINKKWMLSNSLLKHNIVSYFVSALPKIILQNQSHSRTTRWGVLFLSSESFSYSFMKTVAECQFANYTMPWKYVAVLWRKKKHFCVCGKRVVKVWVLKYYLLLKPQAT